MNTNYYSSQSEEFISNTKDCNMNDLYNFFEKYLKKDAKNILYIGFGSGRDSMYFSKKYVVTSIDPTPEFCKYGKEIGLKNVLCQKVEDMTFENEFDRIWACASLLHLDSKDLRKAFNNCYISLKKDGVMYCSFKYGEFEGIRGNRKYLDLNENSFNEYIKDIPFKIADIKITDDVRQDRIEKWLNVILIKGN